MASSGCLEPFGSRAPRQEAPFGTGSVIFAADACSEVEGSPDAAGAENLAHQKYTWLSCQ